jgi:hypothetical protein
MIPILGDLGKAGKWTFKIGQEVLEEAAEKVVKEAAEEVAEKIVKETVEEAGEIIAKEALEESAEKAVKETVEEVVERSAVETVAEAVEKTVRETVEEISGRAPQSLTVTATKETADAAKTKLVKETVTDAHFPPAKNTPLPIAQATAQGVVERVSEETARRVLKEVVDGKVTKLPVDIANGLTDVSARELAEKVSKELGGKRVWVSAKTGSIYVSSPPAEGFALAKQLAQIDLTNTKEVEKILRRIAELTSRGSGNHVILGPFIPNGAFIQEALDTNGIFWDVGDDLWKALAETGLDMFRANDQFLRLQVERQVTRFDIINTDVQKVINNININPPKAWKDITYTEKEIMDLATTPDMPYKLVGNSWVRLDLVNNLE